MRQVKAEKDQPERALVLELLRYRERIESLKECFNVAGLINSSLELEEVLEQIMTTSRGILKADACSLMLVDEKTEELVFEVAQGPVADKLKGGIRLKKGQGIAGCVFETGESVLIEDAYQDPRFNREFDKKAGYVTRSILCVPLKIKGRVIGVSQIINKVDTTPFTSEDEETLSLLCSHAAVAIENARMHRALLRKQQIGKDLEFATSIQLSFLPQDVPRIPRFRFKTFYQAALEVGGDFYDFIPLEDGRLGLLIGDVSGKGVASALYMAKLTSDFRLLAIRHKEPTRLIESINDTLCERSCRGMFVTLLYMVLDTAGHTISYVNAGHIPPLLWNHAEKKMTILRETGCPPVGILEGQCYDTGRIELHAGDCLLLSTDGLIEAKDPQGDRFGLDRLEGIVRQGDSCVDEVYDRVVKAMKVFVQECSQSDDITMILFGLEKP